MEYINDQQSTKDFEKKIRRKKFKKFWCAIIAIIVLFAIIVTTRIDGVNYAFKKVTGQNNVTIEIRCDELSNDMSKLTKPELKKYIPKDGIILHKTKTDIKRKDTVFNVLDRVCREKNIQIEYTYTPLYKAYYIKGINYLYEFHGGRRSGWQYTVNGEKPKYGCSLYDLKGGENIVWYYTVDYLKN